MAHDVFISYATEDKAVADAVCATLEREGLRCWIAPRDVRPGTDWAEAIVGAIKHAHMLVLVFSARANASSHIAREVERAISHGIPIVPFRIEDVIPAGSLEYSLATVHWLDAMTKPLDAHIRRLAETLKAILANKTGPLPLPPPPGPRVSRAVLGAGAAIVLAAGIGGYVWWSRPAPDGASPAGAGLAGQSPSAPVSIAPGRASVPAVATPPVPMPVSDAGREPFKQMALNQQRWFTCGDATCQFTTLRQFFPAVTRVAFGESASQLDRVIDLPPFLGASDPRLVRTESDRYNFQAIPIRPGSAELYVRLEFYDGTKSDVRPAEMPPPNSRRRTEGVRLDAVDPPPGAPAPALFAGYTIGLDKLQLAPDVPFNTAAVMYAIDGRPFERARPQGGGRAPANFPFDAPIADAGIQVKFVLPDGTERGPFRYALTNTPALVLNAFKSVLSADADNVIHCTRVAFTLPLAPASVATAADRQAAARAANRAGSALESKGISFVTTAPIVACIPVRPAGSDYGPWASVREVRLGAEPGKLDQRLAVSADWRDVVSRKFQVREGAALWHALLPAGVDVVFAQLVFRDGTTSRDVRVAVDEIRVPPS